MRGRPEGRRRTKTIGPLVRRGVENFGPPICGPALNRKAPYAGARMEEEPVSWTENRRVRGAVRWPRPVRGPQGADDEA